MNPTLKAPPSSPASPAATRMADAFVDGVMSRDVPAPSPPSPTFREHFLVVVGLAVSLGRELYTHFLVVVGLVKDFGRVVGNYAAFPFVADYRNDHDARYPGTDSMGRGMLAVMMLLLGAPLCLFCLFCLAMGETVDTFTHCAVGVVLLLVSTWATAPTIARMTTGVAILFRDWIVALYLSELSKVREARGARGARGDGR